MKKWNTKSWFIDYCKSHWMLKKDAREFYSILKEYITESLMSENKCVLNWICSFHLMQKKTKQVKVKVRKNFYHITKMKW